MVVTGIAAEASIDDPDVFQVNLWTTKTSDHASALAVASITKPSPSAWYNTAYTVTPGAKFNETMASGQRF